MSGRLSVLVCGDDPITEAGVATQMRGRPEVYVAEATTRDEADVVLGLACSATSSGVDTTTSWWCAGTSTTTR